MPNRYSGIHLDDPNEIKLQQDVRDAEASIVTLTASAARTAVIEGFLSSKQTLTADETITTATDPGSIVLTLNLAEDTTSFEATLSEDPDNWEIGAGTIEPTIDGVSYTSANIVEATLIASTYLTLGDSFTIQALNDAMTNNIASAALEITVAGGVHTLSSEQKINAGASNPTLSVAVSGTAYKSGATTKTNWTFGALDSGLTLASVTRVGDNAVLSFTGTAVSAKTFEITAGANCLVAGVASAKLTFTIET
jgi:hypothetical protein